MDRTSKIISSRGMSAILVLLLSACAGLPEKADVSIGKERFSYALRGAGKPTVIFEAGLGGGMDTWLPVFHEVSTFTTAFAYDRRGYEESGKPVDAPKTSSASEAAMMAGETVLDVVVPGASTVVTLGMLAANSAAESSPRTGVVIVAELHEVLRKTGLQPPYILVGHSLGGLYMSLYARTYPEDVAGLILLDSMHPEQIERCQQYLPADECDPEHYPWWVKTLIKMTPSVIKAEMTGATETGQQIRSAGALPSVPLIVLSHGKPPADEPGMGQMWAALQQDLANESPRSTHIIAQKSWHNIQSDEPELVIQTIKDLVMRAREGSTITK
ncbi:MAG: alpha/beta hydrolase [Pseudomonadota bacterium]